MFVYNYYKVSSTNKNDRHDITEILLKVVLLFLFPSPKKTRHDIIEILLKVAQNTITRQLFLPSLNPKLILKIEYQNYSL
jgi:hypothetical protein